MHHILVECLGELKVGIKRPIKHQNSLILPTVNLLANNEVASKNMKPKTKFLLGDD